MKCYFQGCSEEGTTKEHIPPRSFFPEGEKLQLLTVRSCKKHNNAKSTNDLYVLAQICMNASPSNRAREVFVSKVAPQLSYNNHALRKLLAKDAVQLASGVVGYRVDSSRFDDFFTALSCGVIFKSCGSSLPVNYSLSHIYHNFESDSDVQLRNLEDAIGQFYSGKPMDFMEFGDPEAKNEKIYTVTIFGIPGFKSSITLVHNFFGVFKVTSMLTNLIRVDTETVSVSEPPLG
ncbi:hypothetical protein [Pseudomonas viridiflava]|uniref:hypothetical protein n=1 Tax=Pseudomonas viridiflava TaxID=33069 RepID=UPI000BBD7DA7|nr:hypothetical protein [Pseudomonas viridiflava]PCK92031.1 hypothetical protein PsyrCH409_10685 [Pseudomonas viridiflava]QXG30803.1 hypothetical protein KTT59_01830 [Pseudomonas viridiflava]